MADLPLQSKLLRAVETTIAVSGKSTKEESPVYEGANEVVNAVRRGWSVEYIPLSPTDKDTVLVFLFLVRDTVVFQYTDGCGGTVYNVRMVKDSTKVVRRKGKYTISLELLQNFGG